MRPRPSSRCGKRDATGIAMINAKTVKDQLSASHAVVRWFNAQLSKEPTLLESWRVFNKLDRTTMRLELEYKLEEQRQKE